MNKKKLIIIVVVALVGAGGAYKTVLAKPKEKAPKPKVAGEIYVLPKEFLVNLADDRFAKLQVALVVEHLPVAAGGHGAPTPPEGYGAEPQEAVIRDIITNELTDVLGPGADRPRGPREDQEAHPRVDQEAHGRPRRGSPLPGRHRPVAMADPVDYVPFETPRRRGAAQAAPSSSGSTTSPSSSRSRSGART